MPDRAYTTDENVTRQRTVRIVVRLRYLDCGVLTIGSRLIPWIYTAPKKLLQVTGGLGIVRYVYVQYLCMITRWCSINPREKEKGGSFSSPPKDENELPGEVCSFQERAFGGWLVGRVHTRLTDQRPTPPKACRRGVGTGEVAPP